MEGDPVEKEVEVFSGSVIDANEVGKVLIESLRLGVALFADGVTGDGDVRSGGILCITSRPVISKCEVASAYELAMILLC